MMAVLRRSGTAAIELMFVISAAKGDSVFFLNYQVRYTFCGRWRDKGLIIRKTEGYCGSF